MPAPGCLLRITEKTGKYRSEIGNLELAMGETGLRDSTLVTLGEERDVELPAGMVRVIPAWKRFLAK